MAEEQEPAAGQPKKEGPSLLGRLYVIIGTVIVAVIVASVLVKFMLLPMLAAEESEPPEVPPGAQFVEFDPANVHVARPLDDTLPASLLTYKVSFLCSNAETKALIDANKPWFVDMLRALHSDISREDLDDPRKCDSIKKLALIRANEILTTIQGGENPDSRVLKVFHDEFFVYDQ